jgi:UDP-N-acetylmuramoyl-tripeptide--D-alanyl-D-alanine ligase
LAALNLLAEMEGRRIAVLGGMLELGAYEEEGHRKVGARAAETCHVLVTVGSLADLIQEEALAAGMPADATHRVENNQEAIKLLRSTLAPGDFVLIKGSRAFQMEEIVSALSAPGTVRPPDDHASRHAYLATKSQKDTSSHQEKPR